MADQTVDRDVLSATVREVAGRRPPSPTEDWGSKYAILEHADRIAIPYVDRAVSYHPSSVASPPTPIATTITMELPVDPDDVKTSDVTLLGVYRFLHKQDILAFDTTRLHWVHEYDVASISWRVVVRYHDPLWGRFQWTNLVPEETLADEFHRKFIMEEAINRLQDERELRAAYVMSEIDREVLTRGLIDSLDYKWSTS